MNKLETAITEYLDSMPPMSRVTYIALNSVMLHKFRLEDVKFENEGKRRRAERIIAKTIQRMVRSRKDLRVVKGKGIYKLAHWLPDIL